ncbi:hypothetical protein DdX_09892 [Ditylenchus destructor]|uniref:Uncharacterized protein n=1 Tax=Ditylenchus destructor TaxID=166010 RepID=A0AAD4QZN2_9BILA|nr:hypothetical protein DdX_09892 [Ditylenchus destructor]
MELKYQRTCVAEVKNELFFTYRYIDDILSISENFVSVNPHIYEPYTKMTILCRALYTTMLFHEFVNIMQVLCFPDNITNTDTFACPPDNKVSWFVEKLSTIECRMFACCESYLSPFKIIFKIVIPVLVLFSCIIWSCLFWLWDMIF